MLYKQVICYFPEQCLQSSQLSWAGETGGSWIWDYSQKRLFQTDSIWLYFVSLTVAFDEVDLPFKTYLHRALWILFTLVKNLFMLPGGTLLGSYFFFTFRESCGAVDGNDPFTFTLKMIAFHWKYRNQQNALALQFLPEMCPGQNQESYWLPDMSDMRVRLYTFVSRSCPKGEMSNCNESLGEGIKRINKGINKRDKRYEIKDYQST